MGRKRAVIAVLLVNSVKVAVMMLRVKTLAASGMLETNDRLLPMLSARPDDCKRYDGM